MSVKPAKAALGVVERLLARGGRQDILDSGVVHRMDACIREYEGQIDALTTRAEEAERLMSHALPWLREDLDFAKVELLDGLNDLIDRIEAHLQEHTDG